MPLSLKKKVKMALNQCLRCNIPMLKELALSACNVVKGMWQ